MRIVLQVAYCGVDYHGWQRQQNYSTVQGHLEAAIAHVANHPVTTYCAGRTDQGVHALSQIVHFDTHADRTLDSWLLGINTQLPDDIKVLDVGFVADDFHARFSATQRSYQYLIRDAHIASALFTQYVYSTRKPLDIDAMQAAADVLLGTHDFSAFRSTGCQAKSPIKTMKSFSVIRTDCGGIVIHITADAFLYNMIRNMLGVVIPAGLGKYAPLDVQRILASKDRTCAGVKMPACGLYFAGACYDRAMPIQTVSGQLSLFS